MPAVDIDSTTSGDYTLQWGSGPVQHYSHVATRTKRYRPANVKNVVRPDWTRGPSSFRNEFWKSTTPRVHCTYRSGGITVGGCLVLLDPSDYGLWPWGGSFSVIAEQIAKTQMLTKLSDARVDLGVALAETRRTASMVGNAARQISSGLGSFRRWFLGSGGSPREYRQLWNYLGLEVRGNPRYSDLNFRLTNDNRLGKEVANRVLELNYGWAPLVSDIVGAASMLHDVVNGYGHEPLLTVRGRGSDSRVVTTGYHSDSGLGPDIRYRFDVTHQAQYACTYKLADYKLRALNQSGLINLPSVGWELVPYSFLVDQVINVGAWLNASTAASGLVFKEGSLSRVSFGTLSGPPDIKAPDSGYNPMSLTVLDEGSAIWRAFRREVLVMPPGVPLFPVMRNKLSLTSMVSDIALLAQKML